MALTSEEPLLPSGRSCFCTGVQPSLCGILLHATGSALDALRGTAACLLQDASLKHALLPACCPVFTESLLGGLLCSGACGAGGVLEGAQPGHRGGHDAGQPGVRPRQDGEARGGSATRTTDTP